MLATITGTGDGSAPVVNLTFPFIDKTHVKASVDGVVVAATWTGASQITFASPVPNGSVWKVYRDTPTNPAVVDFTNGAVLTEADLDLAETSHRYRDEELSDLVDTAQSSADDATSAAEAATSAAEAASSAVAGLAPSITSIPNATAHAANRGALGLLAQDAPAYLAEAGREGMFVFDPADHSAHVAADASQGLVIPPSGDLTGASGAWVRLVRSPINPTWFGVIEGDDEANAPTNSAAWAALMPAAKSFGAFRIQFPAGIFWFDQTLDINIGNVVLSGAGGAGHSSTVYVQSIIKTTSGVTAIRLQGEQTSGANTKDAALHSDAKGSIVRDLGLHGAFTDTEAEAHGIQIRTMVSIENVTIENFEGDGIHLSAALASGDGAEPPYGNGNLCNISSVSLLGNRDGIFINGSDANATTITGVKTFANRRWGIQDLSEFGSTVTGGAHSTNGLTAWNDGVTGPATQVSQGGNIYAVIAGQEAWCQTNPPSGTTAHNQGWYYMVPGGPSGGRPAWFSGILVRAGGVLRDNSLVGQGVYSGVYAEGDQGKAQIVEPSLVDGGLLSTWIMDVPSIGGVSGPRIRGGLDVSTLWGAVVAEPMLSVKSGSVTIQAGQGGGNTGQIALDMNHTTLGRSTIAYSTGLGNLLWGRYGGAATYFQITTTGTTSTFGTGAAMPDAFNPVKLIVTDNAGSLANGRRVMIDTAAPTTGAHGVGEIVFNRTPAVGSPMGWVCSVAGTPGTWLPMPNL